MSISFSCPDCGKSFTVDEKFAGKKGRCKQCGGVTQIPEVATSRPAPARAPVLIARDLPSSRPAPAPAPARPAAPSSRPRPDLDDDLFAEAPSPKSKPSPAEDVFGLDEPLPARSAALGSSGPEGAGPAVAVRTRKKKRVGFFAGSKSKKSSSPGGSPVFVIVLRVALGIGGFLASTMVIPGVRQMLMPGWITRGGFEAFCKRQIDGVNELTTALRGVQDVAGASAASPKAIAAIRKMKDDLQANKDTKGSKKDIEEVTQRYGPELTRAFQSFMGELQRVAMIEGALGALGIESVMNEWGETINQVTANGPRMNFTPPPSFRPTFTPPPMPSMNMPPMPGMPMPGMPARSNRDMPPMPGMPAGPGMNMPPMPGMPAMPSMPARPNFPGPRRGGPIPGMPG